QGSIRSKDLTAAAFWNESQDGLVVWYLGVRLRISRLEPRVRVCAKSDRLHSRLRPQVLARQRQAPRNAGEDWPGGDPCRKRRGPSVGQGLLLREDDASSRASLGYLDEREAQLGGYSVSFVQFRPRDPREEPFPALVYIATANNPLYLGPASSVQLADEVMAAKGFCGANSEYVLKLARFMREEVPDCWDDHLFTLESLLKTRLKDSGDDCLCFADNGDQEDRERDAEAEPAAAGVTNDFASSVPSRKLRCLDM
ncbi:hypothetical protein MRX96_024163, partial [Rhipicephalus microplus]